ncbi:MAG: cytochrome b N-terminal domain-containing protein [Candidatus Eremiobacteraeota bacterium]|nr:cytochrome b N-terminal domain-containing protein [Candidatus Eremiobacteraeota bacterium]MBV8721025.1 cytochrome b N-terminal domain-containing protein [Candidatus Eremiobacteraeota bacterium]
MLSAVLNWVEKRTGFVSMTQEFLTEDVPGGASYWYVFGSATLFAMIVQIVTGIFLTFFYAPSAATAWESTRAIYLNPWTHFLLSVHYWGASAMIALVFLHLLQVLIFGAYKSPREIQWVVGVLLLLITLVLGLTGYLLPWDMDAYFASQVSLNITGLPPGGAILQNIAQGGTVMGTNTINRFFGLHVWLMPAALVALVGAHLAIFRHNGSAGPVTDDPRKLKVGRFWPDQMFMDGAFSMIVFIIIVFLALVFPPFLDAKADPTNGAFVPYPAWYFLSLFGLLNLVPILLGNGPFAELLAAIIVPTIGLIVVLILPWLDRSTTRAFGSRKAILWPTALVVAAIVGLSIYAQIGIMAKEAAGPPSPPETDVLAAPAEAASTSGGTAAGPGVSGAAGAPANANGAKVFSTNCASCHGAQGQGSPGAFPPLADNPVVTGDPNKLIGIVLDGLHGSIVVGGSTYNGQMPPWKGTLSNGDVADVLTYIRGSLGSNKASAVTEKQVAGYKP